MSQQLVFAVVAGFVTPDTFYLVNKGTEMFCFIKKVADPCSKTLHAFNWQPFQISTQNGSRSLIFQAIFSSQDGRTDG